jgi:PAS domain S-box-containing protein
VLLIDSTTPLWFAVGILYIVPVVATLPFHSLSLTRVVSVFVSGCIIIGYWASPLSLEILSAGLNRVISMLAVWVTAWVVMHTIHRALALEELQHTLQQRVDLQTQDLTEKHRATLALVKNLEDAQQEIHNKNEEYRLLIEAAPGGMIEVNQNGQIVLVNERICVQFGYVREELLHQPVEMLIPEHLRASHPEHRAEFFDHPVPRPMGANKDLYGLRKDGSEFPIEIGLNPVFVDGGTRILASVVDITQRKQTEGVLQEWTNMLAQSNKDLDDFASITAHDLKEPLRGILGYAQFLVEDYGSVLDEEGVKKCQTIMDLSRRMESLINTLLHYSRVGRTELGIQEVDLNEILSDVLATLAPSLEEKGVTIRYPKPLPVLHCDAARVGEIFRNLITNAMKYNDKNEKWIEIGCTPGKVGAADVREVASGRKENGICFYVRDNGIGIPEIHYQKIFKIFRRLHGRDQFVGGTGAGLSFVEKIVERHKGKIWVESTVGEGTTFWFTLATGLDQTPVYIPEGLACHSS